MTKARDLADLISNSSIDTTEITDSAITTNKINDGAVTAVKLAEDYLQVSGDTMTGDLALSGANVTFGDNDRAIFGAGSDLQIYHDGNNSYITENGTGQLVVNATNLYLRNSDNTQDYLTAVEGGATKLLYADVVKLSTTSTGIDVTGRIEGDTLNIGDQAATHLIQAYDNSGSAPVSFGLGEQVNTARGMRIEKVDEADADPYATNIYFSDHPTSSTGSINFFSSQAKNKTLRINSNGDISFYDTDGATASFVYDASAGSTFNEQGADRDFRVESDNNSNMLFVDAASDKVNIGNASGSYDLNVRKTNSGGDVGFQVSNRDTSQTAGTRALIALQADVDNDGSLEEFLHIRGGTNTAGFAEIVTREGASLRFQGDASTSVVFNDSGVGMDFRVESDTNANMFVIDASANSVGIGTNLPREMLHVSPAGNGKAIIALGDRDQVIGGPHGFRFYHQSGAVGASSYLNYRTGDNSLNIENTSEQQQIKFFALTGAATFNEQGNDPDFRVESDSKIGRAHV